MLHSFRYLAPASWEEAIRLFEEHGPGAKPIAGGTDLLVNIRAGIEKPSCVVDIKRIPGIADLRYDASAGLSIGAGVTINELGEDAAVARHYPVLALCTHELASHQVRNRATVVGNIVNASPCADMAPPLLCLEANIEIRSKSGTRAVPCKSFFLAPKKTVLKPGELVTRVLVPAAMAGARGGYRKLKRIQGHDLDIVGVCLVKKENLIRVAVSSAAPTPVLVRDFSDRDSLETIVEETRRAISPIDDVRCSRDYRLFMVGAYLKRLVKEVA